MIIITFIDKHLSPKMPKFNVILLKLLCLGISERQIIGVMLIPPIYKWEINIDFDGFIIANGIDKHTLVLTLHKGNSNGCRGKHKDENYYERG